MWILSKSDKQVDNKLPTIHFISHIFPTNAADLTFNAGIYFLDLFFSYPCVYHGILDVNFDLIKPTDWVIFSGSDIYHPSTAADVFDKLIFKTGGRVISWGCGYNLQEGNDNLLDISLNKRGFALFTTRDYNFMSEFGKPERYLPCPSCMQPGLKIKSEIVREILVIEHKWFPIHDFPQYEKVNNSIQALQLLSLIASSRVVITNSYHMLYWATLMGKKVILTGKYASKFDFFKYTPVIYSGDLQSDIERAVNYPHALNECRQLNIEFANEVISLIKNDNGQPRDLGEINSDFFSSYDDFNKKQIYELNGRVSEFSRVEEKITHLHEELHGRIDQLHEELHGRINQLQEEKNHLHEWISKLHEEKNQLHEELHGRINQLHEELHGRINQLQEEKNQLHEELHEGINRLQEEKDQLHEELHGGINQLHEEINQLRDEKNRQLEERDSQLTIEINRLREETGQLREEKDRQLEERDNQLTIEITHLREEINKKTSLRYFAGNIKRFFHRRLFKK